LPAITREPLKKRGDDSGIRDPDENGRPPRLDAVDQRIIAILQADGRRPFSRIAREIDVSESVVRYRVARLEEHGLLQIVGIADPLRIGFDRMALLGVRVQPGRLADVCAAVTALPETSYVAETAGSFDVFVEVICRDTAHFAELLKDRIHRIDGVTSVESFLVLEIHKLAYGWGVPVVETARRHETTVSATA
jgi:Lrp/AsnC family transcriptional regulator for asnA, asnC and gidA